MKSYTQLRTTYGKDTKNTSSDNLTYGDEMMNDFHRKILSKRDWPFLHRLRTALTIAGTQFVPLPYDVDMIESVFTTVGATRYTPKPCPSRERWDELNQSTVSSDDPEYWFVYNGEIGLWPTPATSDIVISMNAKIRVRDLNTADITNSTITTLANGSTALTVNAGLTAQMVGFWIRPTFSTTVNTGDGLWYELSSITNATTGALVRKYGGVSIAAGSAACTIGQMPLLPEAYQPLPEIYAAYRYWSKEKDSRAGAFKAELLEGVAGLEREYSSGDLSMIIDDLGNDTLINPNLVISM